MCCFDYLKVHVYTTHEATALHHYLASANSGYSLPYATQLVDLTRVVVAVN